MSLPPSPLRYVYASVVALLFYHEKGSTLSVLIDSRRIALCGVCAHACVLWLRLLRAPVDSSLLPARPLLPLRTPFRSKQRSDTQNNNKQKLGTTTTTTTTTTKTARAMCVTGTPALSRPAELFMQLKALMPDTFRAFHPFAVRRVHPSVRAYIERGCEEQGLAIGKYVDERR